MDRFLHQPFIRVVRAVLSAFTALAGFQLAQSAEILSRGDVEFFEKNIRPILVERCYECHGPEKQKGGLRLDSRAAVLKGGESGPSVNPGKPAESLLWKAV